jgi:hypothetical protein
MERLGEINLMEPDCTPQPTEFHPEIRQLSPQATG